MILSLVQVRILIWYRRLHDYGTLYCPAKVSLDLFLPFLVFLFFLLLSFKRQLLFLLSGAISKVTIIWYLLDPLASGDYMPSIFLLDNVWSWFSLVFLD